MTDSARDLCVGFFDDVSAGRFAEAWERLAPNVVYEVVAPEPYGGVFDRAGLGATAAKVMERLAEPLKVTVTNVIVDGDRVAIETVSSARAKSGMLYRNRYHFAFRVSGDRIVEGREYLDSAHYKGLMDG